MPAVRKRKAEQDADPDEFGLGALLALAGGGIIGSGWLLGGYSAAEKAGSWAWLCWLLGGALMFVVALVMVELGRNAPENGGLVSWPSMSSGPLVGVVVAAALWIFYALNPASEAAAVVQAFRVRSLYDFDPNHPGLTKSGEALSAVIMALIVASNLLAFSLIKKGTIALTTFKTSVPLLVLGLLFLSGFDRHAVAGHPVTNGDGVVRAVISAITGGGVIYAYVGFQGPLDFAGQVRSTEVRRFGIRLNEGTRLRIAVLATVLGSVVLYTLLQVVYLGHTGWTPGNPDSPYTTFAAGLAVTSTMFVVLLRIDAAVSPAGAGIVYALLLAREVESLSQIRLTDSRLATPRRLWRGGPERMVSILLANLAIGWIGLYFLRGKWDTMASASSVMILLVYSMTAVSLMAFRAHYSGTGRFPLSRWWWVPVWIGFVGVCEVLYWAEWPVVSRGMVFMAFGVSALLLLPVLSHRIQRFRLYDAENLLTRHLDRNRFEVYGAVVLAAHLVVLLLLTALGMPGTHRHAVLPEPAGSVLVAVLGTVTLLGLHYCSVGYMRARPPLLRQPSGAQRREI